MKRALAALGLWCVLWAAPAFAVLPDEMLPDPGKEARARTLSAELRCLVCQNQSIDDSNADLARDLRLLLRERIKAGDTDGQVLDFLVARYGEFVLLKPRLNAHTVLLWLTPALLLVFGASGLLWAARGRRISPAATLSAVEEARLEEIFRERR